METIVLNGNHLKNSDIQKRISKSRCIFIDERNRLLVERVEDFYVLPGGKLELKENIGKVKGGLSYDDIIRQASFLWFSCPRDPHPIKSHPKH